MSRFARALLIAGFSALLVAGCGNKGPLVLPDQQPATTKHKKSAPADAKKPGPATKGPVVRIGAVAYAPSAVTVFEGLRRYFATNGMAIDYVLYSNYDALGKALREGHVDIAWNTPLAHARYHLQAGGASQTLVMRDVDCNYRCTLVVRKG